MFDVVFSAGPVIDYRGVMRGDAGLAGRFNRLLRQQGVLKSDSKFYISHALSEDDLARTVDAIAYAARHIHTLS
jgi:glutamate-1-semialdehyde 2,1-aminomutase